MASLFYGLTQSFSSRELVDALLRNRLLAAVIVTMAALGWAGVFLVPRVAARYMKGHDRPEQSVLDFHRHPS
jgi:hypothetical protein